MTENYAESPTVALVHGAFADGGSFAAVTELLLAAGVKVQALVNPLRGLAVDSAYVASALGQIDGPVLAGCRSCQGVKRARVSNSAGRRSCGGVDLGWRVRVDRRRGAPTLTDSTFAAVSPERGRGWVGLLASYGLPV